MFFSKSSIMSGLTFRSLIHFELIFVCDIRKCFNFILLHVAVLFSQHHVLKRLFSIVYSCLCQRLRDQKYELLNESITWHCFCKILTWHNKESKVLQIMLYTIKIKEPVVLFWPFQVWLWSLLMIEAEKLKDTLYPAW